MIYDALLTVALPSTAGPPLPTDWLDGFERMLFHGRWSRRVATCDLASATVLARCHAALRDVPHTGLAIDGDADELLSLRIAPPGWGRPDPWAERLPPRWTTEPCDFRLRTSWSTEHLHVALTLRYTPRHDPEVGALTGGLRAAWRVAEDVPDLARALYVTLDDDGLAAVRRLVAIEGSRIATGLLDGLRTRFTDREDASEIRERTVVPVEPEAMVELLAGLPDRAIAVLAAIAAEARRSGRWWPALDRHGVPGWLGRDRFAPAAEVSDVL